MIQAVHNFTTKLPKFNTNNLAASRFLLNTHTHTHTVLAPPLYNAHARAEYRKHFLNSKHTPLLYFVKEVGFFINH